MSINIAGRLCLGGRMARTQLQGVPHLVRANSSKLWEAIGRQLRGTASLRPASAGGM